LTLPMGYARPDTDTLLEYCKLALPGWQNVHKSAVSCMDCAGGASFQMVIRVSSESATPEHIVVKVNLAAISQAALSTPRSPSDGTMDRCLEDRIASSASTEGIGASFHVSVRGVTLMEWLPGGVVFDGIGASWLDNLDDARAFGNLIARFHQQPLNLLSSTDELFLDHVKNGSLFLAEFHPFAMLRDIYSNPEDFPTIERALKLAPVEQYGHSCVEIVGWALGLRACLERCGERYKDESLSSDVSKNWLCLLDFMASFAPRAYSILPSSSPLGRLVVGHGDLHSKNLMRRKAGVHGDIVLIDFDRVHRMPAAVDIASSLLMSFLDDAEPYPSLESRSALVAAYINQLGIFGDYAVSEALLDIEKGVMARALQAPLFLIRGMGLTDAFLPSWTFAGISARAFKFLSQAEENLEVKKQIIKEGLKAMVLGPSSPLADQEEFLRAPGAAEKWFPDVPVRMRQ